jgi:FkbM family methyltransferase
MRNPVKLEALKKLRAMNVPVGSVIDVGVNAATAELIEAYGDRRHLLIEPIAEWNERIKINYQGRVPAFEVLNVAVSDSDGVAQMKLASVIPGTPISHSNIVRGKAGGGDVREVPAARLSTLVAERTLPKPYLLKIDVDGAEMLVLEGARDMLADCSIVVIEVKPENLFERGGFLDKAGFELFDIVDPCYYDDRFRQADLVFLNRKLIKELSLNVRLRPFDIKRWHTFRVGQKKA